MIRKIVCTAVAAAFVALAAPAPAQAAMLDPGLATAAPSMVQDVRWWWRHRYWYHRHWRCWYVRVHVRVRHHWEWRTVRRCAWRYW
jgi:hypothetical protein